MNLSETMKKEKNKAENKKEMSGCQGCLLIMVIALALLTIPFIVYHFHYSNNRKKYMQDPYPAHREYVEGMSGVKFPPYKLKETILGSRGFDYLDTIKLEFENIPDSTFLNELDLACKEEFCLSENYKYNPWHYNDEKDWYCYHYAAVRINPMWDTIRNMVESRGVPRDFVECDRHYESWVSPESKEWTIIVALF